MITLNQLHYKTAHYTCQFDLHIAKGEHVAVLGENGAGKSTLLNLIMGFIPPSSGSILLNGQDYTHAPVSKRPVAMLFQENNLFPHLTVKQNILLAYSPSMRLSKQQMQHFINLSEQMKITAFWDRLPQTLSGGQKQRVALTRALAQSQPILLLDEPFSALDEETQAEMMILLNTVQKERQLTLLHVSHQKIALLQIATRKLVIHDGKIKENKVLTQ